MGNKRHAAITFHEIGVTDPTSRLLRKKYGGSRIDQVKRFKQIERENDRFWELIADLSIDNAILRETAEDGI